MKKIAEMNATADEDTYLYKKDVYDPTAENAGETGETDETDDAPQEGGTGGTTRQPQEENDGGSSFELPDFLKDVHDGVIKIE